MQLAQAIDALLADLEPGLAQQLIGEQPAAHADLAMDAPDRELDAFGIERFLPRQHVLIDAVDQRAVEIEQKGVLGAHGLLAELSVRATRDVSAVILRSHLPMSSSAQAEDPVLLGRPDNIADAGVYWIPAFAGMTPWG